MLVQISGRPSCLNYTDLSMQEQSYPELDLVHSNTLPGDGSATIWDLSKLDLSTTLSRAVVEDPPCS